MSDIKKLHTSPLGYKKSEVHSYLLEMSAAAEKEALKYKDEAVKTNEQLNESTQQAAQLRRELEEMKKAHEDIKAELAAIENKKRLISQTLIDAKNRAEEVIAEASKKAQEITDQVQAECDERRHLANIDLDNINREVDRTRGAVYAMKLDVLSAMEKYKQELESIAATSDLGGLK